MIDIALTPAGAFVAALSDTEYWLAGWSGAL